MAVSAVAIAREELSRSDVANQSLRPARFSCQTMIDIFSRVEESCRSIFTACAQTRCIRAIGLSNVVSAKPMLITCEASISGLCCSGATLGIQACVDGVSAAMLPVGLGCCVTASALACCGCGYRVSNMV